MMPARPAGAPRATPVAGFLLGILAVLGIGGGWLAFGAPNTWPAGISLAVRERQGEQVYNANCLSCHLGPVGGTTQDYPPRHNANGHTWHHPDCALKRIDPRRHRYQPRSLDPRRTLRRCRLTKLVCRPTRSMPCWHTSARCGHRSRAAPRPSSRVRCASNEAPRGLRICRAAPRSPGAESLR